ncbi:putative origin recognition complex subunit orc5 protein [Cladorrhinum samala]|uniref:Origin recognition complex subunit orc5 protein n=1 Tax=Cladorrhinum samala TaxID=585594 RepID=A0AAV9HYT6_9PEZI|nr:putative origin recognition complex subunit orc5 protein [Cladorrhinum samala]
MASSVLFQLPDELISTCLSQTFPCRDSQIRVLATLLDPNAAPCRNLVVYGTEATGKTAITTAALAKLEESCNTDNGHDDEPLLRHAIINSTECITARHLYESVVDKVSRALQWPTTPPRCETVSQLVVELSKMLKYTTPPRPNNFRFVLVFDGIDRQREAPHTLLPALARLSEIIPALTTIFIVTSPPSQTLRISFVPHLHFPAYTKSEFITILSSSPPPTIPNTTPQETHDLWARFLSSVHDALARSACRTLPSFQDAAQTLWPRFVSPIISGTHSSKEFSKLLVLSRVHFQDESLLDPSIIARPTTGSVSAPPPPPPPPKTAAPKTPDLASLLPTTARLLLLAAYLASHNATKHDLTLFSTFHHGRRRRRGGLAVAGAGSRAQRSKHRKIARKLLGAHAFVLERMLAIFAAVRGEWDPEYKEGKWGNDESGSDIGMAIATLASLRLLVRVGGVVAGGDPMDLGGKWRINVGWEVVRGLGRSMGVEVEEWLME